MKIASFNVNSIGARLPRVLEWLDAAQPDVVAFQEIKCIDEKFPAEPFEERGYNLLVHGQKTYNGVALASKWPMEDARRGLPDPAGDDEQARYVEALIVPDGAPPLRIGGLYAPNGNPAPGPKYDYKLAWTARLEARARALLAAEEAFALIGDYNVIPQAEDCRDPAAWEGDALWRPESRAALRRLLNLGLTDALRQIEPVRPLYTFWDYQGGAWRKDDGIRIDHILLSPQAADRLEDAGVDRDARGLEKASDHAPVWARLS